MKNNILLSKSNFNDPVARFIEKYTQPGDKLNKRIKTSRKN